MANTHHVAMLPMAAPAPRRAMTFARPRTAAAESMLTEARA